MRAHIDVLIRVRPVFFPAPPPRCRQINCGQLEELIVQAEEELKLAAKMKEWKAWEPLAVTPPPNQGDRA